MSTEKYCKILAGKVKMPGKTKYQLDEYARKIRDRIAREYRGFYPDNGIIDLLCNAAWLGCEMLQLRGESVQSYCDILAGKVAMPGRMKYSLVEFAHKIANRIAIENRGNIPDTDTIHLLQNAAWLGCEQIEWMER